jgi:hypothetical protein
MGLRRLTVIALMMFEELGAGTVPAKVVAHLQAHPETNYVWGAFGDLTLGVRQAIKTAGLAEKVKVITMNGIEPADAIIRNALGLPFPTKIYEEAPQSRLIAADLVDRRAGLGVGASPTGF